MLTRKWRRASWAADMLHPITCASIQSPTSSRRRRGRVGGLGAREQKGGRGILATYAAGAWPARVHWSGRGGLAEAGCCNVWGMLIMEGRKGRIPMRNVWLVLRLAGALGFSGCARPGALAAARQSSAATEVVGMSRFHFVPQKITIRVGQSVEWNNTAALETHTVTADPALAKKKESVELPAGAEPFNSGDLKPTQTFRHTFTVAGHYRYFCIPHERMGMIGEVDVLPVGSVSPGATSSP